MRFGSGSYDVRRCEGLNPLMQPMSHRTINCVVVFLDGTEKSFVVDRQARGEVLLEKVFTHLELVEKDFFGLQFLYVVDAKDTFQEKRWLDPKKSVRKQMLCPPYHLYFRVKFYVNDPAKLVEEYTRYHYYLQLRQNILDGSLPVAEGSLALLASYALQSELGDYSKEDHPDGYVENFHFCNQVVPNFAKRVCELHRMHTGQSPAEAEFNFLDHAKRIPKYGVDWYNARDGKGLPIEVGVNSHGIIVFHDGVKVNEFAWALIMKISFKKKYFYVQIRDEQSDVDTVLSFLVDRQSSCKLLWKSCIEHHSFFRLIAPPTVPSRSRFHLGSRYRYSGRTEFQTMEDIKSRARVERAFLRSTNGSSIARSTLSSGPSCNSSETFTPPTASPESSLRYHSDSSAPSQRRRHNRETTFGVSEDEADERSWTPAAMQACTSTATVHHRPPLSSAPPSQTRKSTNGYVSNGHANTNGYAAATWNGNGYQHGSGTLSRATLAAARASPRLSQLNNTSSPRSSLASYSSTSHHSTSQSSPPRARRSPQSNKSNSPVGEDQLVTVRMRPDLQGRFGFNVKGGADQNYPVIVSRVAPGSPADKCHPRLNEGDQVISINGVDVAQMAHDDVVAFIRSARSSPLGGELTLTIKPNVYRLAEELDAPDTTPAVPESARVAESIPRSDKLSHSLRILNDALVSGKIIQQFETAYRKKAGMAMNDCRLAINVNKNRYRDVCPYDSTRVLLKSSPSGDYINANYVNMEIPSSGIINRYIACQGPLAHTSADFWLMVWEQQCMTIVMLTTTVERGRVKCHQYWPRLYESQEYGRLVITCLKDKDTSNCSYREFSVKDRTTREERRVTQMQYTAWPDHGVPDDPKHFISFADEVRKTRAGNDPIIVHCSAGIGRTGVLILFETAACLVEANEPVYPSDLMRTMRDQRAMLIQTPGQYTFVCESILRAYNEGFIKPLAEYQKR